MDKDNSRTPPNITSNSQPPQQWNADKMLNAYIYDYLHKNGCVSSAEHLKQELLQNGYAENDLKVPVDAPTGFLREWWHVFWDIFTARTKQHVKGVRASQEALFYMDTVNAQRQLDRMGKDDFNVQKTGQQRYGQGASQWNNQPSAQMEEKEGVRDQKRRRGGSFSGGNARRRKNTAGSTSNMNPNTPGGPSIQPNSPSNPSAGVSGNSSFAPPAPAGIGNGNPPPPPVFLPPNTMLQHPPGVVGQPLQPSMMPSHGQQPFMLSPSGYPPMLHANIGLQGPSTPGPGASPSSVNPKVPGYQSGFINIDSKDQAHPSLPNNGVMGEAKIESASTSGSMPLRNLAEQKTGGEGNQSANNSPLGALNVNASPSEPGSQTHPADTEPPLDSVNKAVPARAGENLTTRNSNVSAANEGERSFDTLNLFSNDGDQTSHPLSSPPIRQMSKDSILGEDTTFLGHSGKVTALSFCSSGNWLVSGGQDKTVRLWSLRDQNRGLSKDSLQGHSKPVTSLSSPVSMSHVFASGSIDCSIRVWTQVHTRDEFGSWVTFSILNNNSPIQSICFHPSIPDYLLSTDQQEQLKIWNPSRGQCVQVMEGISKLGCYQPVEGSNLIAGASESVVRLYDTRMNTVICELKGHERWISGLCWSGDGNKLVSVSEDSVRVWDIEHSKELKMKVCPRGDKIQSVCFHPYLQNKVVLGGYQVLGLWDFIDDSMGKLPNAHRSHIVTLTQSKAAKLIASACVDSTVKIWKLHSDQPEQF
eukprot:GCRY01006103.1.p1 GENE.GCRY01006103.1~~GCRY01006103.1.p1  ORF type:complete len:756 (-),score=75.48 GCRY01006103.1:440-2707(-)